MKEMQEPTQNDLERINEIERALSGEEESDGPTGDPWLDKFMEGDDDDYFNWENDVDGKR